MQKIRSILIRLFVAAVLLGVPTVLVYLQQAGFSTKWREKVAEALGGSAYRVTIGKLTFHPFEGIVAESVDVVLRDEHRTVAEIDRLSVSPNLADLLVGRVTIDRLAVQDGLLSIPFANDGVEPGSVVLKEVNAEIINTHEQLRISLAECVVENIRISVTGSLLNPARTVIAAPGDQKDPARRARILRAALEALSELKFSGDLPHLQIEIAGDLSDPPTLRAPRIALKSGPVQFRDFSFSAVSLLGRYADHQLDVTALSVAGPTAELLAMGDWNTGTASGNFSVSGEIDPGPVLAAAGQDELAEDAHFIDRVRLTARAVISSQPGASKVIGSIAAGKFDLRSVDARALEGDFAWQGSLLTVQNATLQLKSGTVEADIFSAPEDFRIRLRSDIVPTELLPLFGPKEREILGLMEFEDAPRIQVTLTGTAPKFDALRGEGSLELGRTAMRGSWIDFADAQLVIGDRAVLYKNFVLGKGRQRGTGSFTYDFGKREVRLDDVKSNLMPADVLMWIDPRIAETVSVYRFRSPPDVRVAGLVHMQYPDKNSLDIDVEAPGGLDYKLIGRNVPFGATSATVKLKGRKVLADISRAGLFGGSVAVNTTVSIDPKHPVFSADVSVSKVDFASLTKLYFDYQKSEGLLSGRYSFSARLQDDGSMQGRGSIRVQEGHILAIPVFGPLSEIISAIIPGAGHDRAKLATADFTIADRRISTKDLEIEGSGFTMFGDGSVAFPSGKMEMAVRINARGIPGIVLFPVSKLLEYVSTGTVADPQWHPKIIPKELLGIPLVPEKSGSDSSGGGAPPRPVIRRR